jgi:hypothetical protein
VFVLSNEIEPAMGVLIPEKLAWAEDPPGRGVAVDFLKKLAKLRLKSPWGGAQSKPGKVESMKRVSLALMAVFFFLSAAAQAREEIRVTQFSPQGTVKKVRQARATFSEAMVAFGDPGAATDPFIVGCSEEGQGRWTDPRNWVYDFRGDLPAGVRCSFRLRPDLKSLSGKALSPQEFGFATGGPAILMSVPYEGHRGISEDQIFVLKLDAAAEEGSVLGHAGFVVPGLKERIGARIVTGEERQRVLDSQPWLSAGDPTVYLLLQCRQRLPVKSRVSLVWGRGIRSLSGVATGRDQVLNFETRPSFLAEFSCERENPRAGCIPVRPMRLRFNAPIDPQFEGEVRLKGSDGSVWTAPLKAENGDVTFKGPFPEKAQLRLEIPGGLKDDAGRPLLNADKFPLRVRTAGYPPLAKFSARFGIIELRADPVLPVTLRNIETDVKAGRIEAERAGGPAAGVVTGRLLALPPEQAREAQGWLRRVAEASREKSLLTDAAGAREVAIPKPGGASALEVVGIPLEKPGLYIVEIESAVLGRALLDPPKPMFVPAAALVTNLAVHLKRGRESSLVWVTTLDRAEPVAQAAVEVMNCEGAVLWQGRTDATGIARIDARLPLEAELPSCPCEPEGYDTPQMGALRRLDGGLFVTARSGEDMSFVHSSWDQGIEAWRFRVPEEAESGAVVAHSVFDRSLLRAGETLHMKHLIRRHTMDGFSAVAVDELPDTVSIRHAGSGQFFEMSLAWDAAGIAETAWPIPKEAKLGVYAVDLIRKAGGGTPPGPAAVEREDGASDDSGSRRLTSGRFRVEQFRVPLLKGVIKPPAEPLVDAGEIPLDLSIQYLAGGGAGLLPITLRAEIGPKRLPAFEGLEGFVFGNGGVREGTVRRGESAEAPGGEGRTPLPPITLTLDAAGAARTRLAGLPSADTPREVTAEMEFQDPNGEIQTVSSRIPLWNSRVLAGIRPERWAMSKEALKFDVAVVTLSGRPVAGAAVRVDVYERRVFSHRKRLAGGFYAYDHTVEIRRVATLAEGKTDVRGLLPCEVKPPVAGEVILVAETRDEAGRRALAHRSVWVSGRDDWWFEAEDHDRMDLLPERKRYEPGETARFQVRMPFREATALVAVEREGVMEASVRKISGREPVVAVPVQGHHAPNVFVSVLAVRGRTGEVQPTAMADLGKPAFRLGWAEIDVGWRAHALKVSVTAERPVYKTGESARVTVRAATADGQPLPAGSEVALAAVDEGLLELMENSSWGLLAAMMGRRGCEVQTATAQMHVVGKRHYGIKALAQGGGGGRQATRELFDTLLLWKARLPLDDHGSAVVDVPLNDAITSFRIAAVASGGMGLFGTGETSIQSTRDLMVFSGLPPLVREGDLFRAGITVRNASAAAMTVDARASAPGVALSSAALTAALAPGEARVLAWEVTVPPGVEHLSWEFETVSRETGDRDRLRISQKVAPAVPMRVFQAAMAALEGDYRLAVARPSGALAGGGVRIAVRPRIGDGLTGVTDYMRGYPYGCLEQKLSTAVALQDRPKWERLAAELPAYMDPDGLLKYFPSAAQGDPVLTAYAIAVTHEAGWPLADDLLERIAGGLKRYVEGGLPRYASMPTADLTLRKLAAVEALSRVGRADLKLVGSLAIEPAVWPTSAVLDWVNILLNLDPFPDRGRRLSEAEQTLRARLTYQGSLAAFSTDASDRLWWLMVSTDVNAARLLLTAQRLDSWKQDLPQLARGTLARQRRGHWDLTTANAWGVLAMQRFSKAFEAEPVTGSTRVELSGPSAVVDWSGSPQGETALLPWPESAAELNALHAGGGKPWLSVQSLAAVPLREPLAAGYTLRKSVSAVSRTSPERWSRGDILRVRLEIEAQADMTWVVADDPVPAGATILGSGLGRDSGLLSRGEAHPGPRPVFEERTFEGFRAYYEFVPKGKWSLEYTLRLNQDGRFHLPPTRVEALYAPEMYGETPNSVMVVEP